MMKKRLLLMTLALLLSVVGWAVTEIDGIYYNLNESSKTAEVSAMPYPNKYSGNITIPQTITYDGADYSVTAIGSNAFQYCSGLTSVVIPNGITAIGRWAFYGCSNLYSIAIPNSLINIGESALDGTAWYEGLPDGVVYVGQVVYKYKGTMPSDTKIIIKHGTIGISPSAFYGYRDLVSVTLPNSITFIADKAFESCWYLTEINIPDGIEEIGYEAFNGCSRLASISIPYSVKNIGSRAFESTQWFDEQPNGLVYAGPAAYKYKGWAPANTTVVIKEGTTSISSEAFRDCLNLTSVTIPSSVTNIGSSVFWGCSGLKEISVDANNKRYDSREDCNAVIETATNCLIAGCMNTTIPNSIISIGTHAFEGCTGLKSLDIPSSVKIIESNAFYGCSDLTTIRVATANGIYDSRDNCNAIIETSTAKLVLGCSSTIIPDGITTIGENAFEQRNGLYSIKIPSSVTSIGYCAFLGCENLNEVYCYAEEAPTVEKGGLDDNYINTATLHVPAASVANYQSTAPWSSFKEIVAIESSEDSPTYEELSAKITEIAARVKSLSDHCSEVTKAISSFSRYLPNTEKTTWEGTLTNAAEQLSAIMAKTVEQHEMLREASPSEYSSIGQAIVELDNQVEGNLWEIRAFIQETENDIADYAKEDIERRIEDYHSYIIYKCNSTYSDVSQYVNLLFGEEYFFQRTASGDNEKYVTSLKTWLDEVPSDIKYTDYYVYEEAGRLSIDSFEDVVTGYKLIDNIENLIDKINKECLAIRQDADYYAASMPLIFPDEEKSYSIAPYAIGGNVSIGYQVDNGFGLSENGKITFEQVDGATFYLKDADGHYLVALNDTRELTAGTKDEATLWKGSSLGNGRYRIEQNSYPPYLSYSESNEGFALQISYGSCDWTITEWHEAEENKNWSIGTEGDFADFNAAMSDNRVKDGDILHVLKGTSLAGASYITKAVTIEGNGYEKQSDGYCQTLYVDKQGVNIKSLYANSIYIRGRNVTIERCRAEFVSSVSGSDAENTTIRGCWITGHISGVSNNYARGWKIYNNIVGGLCDNMSFIGVFPMYYDKGYLRYLDEATIDHNAILYYEGNNPRSSRSLTSQPARVSKNGVEIVTNSEFTNNIILREDYDVVDGTVLTDAVLNSATKFEYNIHSNAQNPTEWTNNIAGYADRERDIFVCSAGIFNDKYYILSSESPAIGYANDGGNCGPWSGPFPYLLNGIDNSSQGGGRPAPGDMDGDGEVSYDDAQTILNYILGIPSESFDESVADVNGDKVVNILDVTAIIQMLTQAGQ